MPVRLSFINLTRTFQYIETDRTASELSQKKKKKKKKKKALKVLSSASILCRRLKHMSVWIGTNVRSSDEQRTRIRD